jgi:hypothetical protein
MDMTLNNCQMVGGHQRRKNHNVTDYDRSQCTRFAGLGYFFLATFFLEAFFLLLAGIIAS